MNKGELQTISRQNNAVQIDGVWYTLDQKIKIEWLKKGEVEYNYQDSDVGNPILLFCKNTQSSPSQPARPQTQSQFNFTKEETYRMSALKFVGNIYMGAAKEDFFTVDGAMELVNNVVLFLKNGTWKVQQT